MRNCDALSEARRTQALALADAREDLACIGIQAPCSDLSQLLKQGALVAARKGRFDRIEIEKFGKLHTLLTTTVGAPRPAWIAWITNVVSAPEVQPSRYYRRRGGRSCSI